MTWFSVDVEATGPAPGLYSMTSLGAVAVRHGLADRFHVELRPLPGAAVVPAALAVGGLPIEHFEANGLDPAEAMHGFADWVRAVAVGRPVLVSDNPGFDAGFVAYYFAAAGLENPFGHSSRRIGDLYSGLMRDAAQGSAWKILRSTEHTHDALDDAVGNAEALLRFAELGLRIPLD